MLRSPDPARRSRPRTRRLPPKGSRRGGFQQAVDTPREFPTRPHTSPTSSCKFPQPVLSVYTQRGDVDHSSPLPPAPAHLLLPSSRGTPPPRPREPEGLRQVPPPERRAGPLELHRAELGCFRARPLRTRHWAALAGSLAASPQSAAAAAACGPGGWEKRSVGE